MALVRRRKWRQRYVKFRGGTGFIWALTAFLGGYHGVVFTLWLMGVSWWPWLLLFAEAPFILLNLLLSIEASYAMPVLLMEQERRAEEQAQALEQFKQEVLTLLREGRASDKDMAQWVKNILGLVEEMEGDIEEISDEVRPA